MWLLHHSMHRSAVTSFKAFQYLACTCLKQSKLDTFGTHAAQSKLSNFFEVLTKEEKAEMNAREWERLRDSQEEREAREREERYATKVQATAEAVARKRKSWAKQYDEKVAVGWVPAQVGRNRKIVELQDFDPGPSALSSTLAKDSRPHRQFKEDVGKNNKPQGRKRKPERKPENAMTVVKQVNWMNPLLWS
ncbi:hypothetical protein B0H10DRAFT_1950736 [Mycena sp. CBHHK59/15]|nr:hypothetical protein B0H10DRAFT_1950736 [Mycena sp. CBHHK59/15]